MHVRPFTPAPCNSISSFRLSSWDAEFPGCRQDRGSCCPGRLKATFYKIPDSPDRAQAGHRHPRQVFSTPKHVKFGATSTYTGLLAEAPRGLCSFWIYRHALDPVSLWASLAGETGSFRSYFGGTPKGKSEIIASRLSAGEPPWDMLSLKAAINHAEAGVPLGSRLRLSSSSKVPKALLIPSCLSRSLRIND